MMKRIETDESFWPLLDKLLQDRESNDVEFKSAAGGFPRTFWETYSSFANTNGGTIIFGVKEEDGRCFLDGLTEEMARKHVRDFFNGMHNKQNVNIAILREDDVRIVEYGSGCFVFFYVPRVDRSIRPVYCGLDPYSGTYRRDLDGDYHCSRGEINSMFADSNLAYPVDGRILKNFSKADLDADSIRQYRRRFEQWNPDHVWNVLSEDAFLEKLNVFRKDRATGDYGLTYAGLLMFGTYSAIMDENPNFFPDYQEIQDPKDRWVNRICPDGNWESNLFQFYSRVLPTLQNFLPKPFILDGNQRKTETAAYVAVREALANALVHADYTENASLNIYKYPNKIVFSNPGTMLISLRQYYKGGESVCRNKYLQTMFTFLGMAEKAGSGVDKIIHGWDETKWKRPYVEERCKPNKVVLTLPMESLLDNAVKANLQELFGEKLDGLPHPQLMTLALACSEEEITNERLQCTLEMHRSDITDMLGKMCAGHLLESVGHGRGTRYHIPGLNIALPKSNLTSPKSNLALPKSNLASPKSNLTSPKSNLTSPKSNLALPKSNLTSPKSNLAPRKKRYTRQELQKRILTFCAQWRTVEEIADAVGRDSKYIKNKVLPKMERVMEKMYAIPHHPKQKYRTKQAEMMP